MVKGHMEKGKFHPHTQYKGVSRKSRNRFHPKGYKPPTIGKKKPAGTWEITKTSYGSSAESWWDLMDTVNRRSLLARYEPKWLSHDRRSFKELNPQEQNWVKESLALNRKDFERKARYAFDNSEEHQVIIPEYSRGDIVMVSPENDNEGYDDFRNKKLRITDVSTNIGEHRGFDESVGQALYELETLNGEQIFSSLYDYELVSA